MPKMKVFADNKLDVNEMISAAFVGKRENNSYLLFSVSHNIFKRQGFTCKVLFLHHQISQLLKIWARRSQLKEPASAIDISVYWVMLKLLNSLLSNTAHVIDEPFTLKVFQGYGLQRQRSCI